MTVRVARILPGVIDPVLDWLDRIGLAGDKRRARALLFAIGMAESGYRINHQVHGPALGYWQMEPATAHDIHRWVKRRHHPDLGGLLSALAGGLDPDLALEFRPEYSCCMARCFFLRIPEPLPSDCLERIADYWKRYYNTEDGAGTVGGFIDRVAPVWKF